MTKRLFGAAAALLIAAGGALAATPSGSAKAVGTISDLAWMAGSWGGTKEGVAAEEHWTTPEGGALVGMHKDVKAGKMTSFAFARITVDGDGRVCYLAAPLGDAPTPFCAIELDARRVVFENREHDFPQRVLYWLADGRMHARIEG